MTEKKPIMRIYECPLEGLPEDRTTWIDGHAANWLESKGYEVSRASWDAHFDEWSADADL
jgi:hypothetical protein